MNPALYILCEGERDELFYERICERLTGLSFSRPQEFRLRVGENWKSAVRKSRILLDRYSRIDTPQQIAILIAIDNDRAPGHPGGRTYPKPLPGRDQKEEPRFPRLKEMISTRLGEDPARRNVHAVIAMPVEMIESWLLLLTDPALTEGDLPPFAEAASKTARQYYGNAVPPQLKDLRDFHRMKTGHDPDSLFFEAADTGDLDHLARVSPSFAVFREEVAVLTQKLA